MPRYLSIWQRRKDWRLARQRHRAHAHTVGTIAGAAGDGPTGPTPRKQNPKRVGVSSRYHRSPLTFCPTMRTAKQSSGSLANGGRISGTSFEERNFHAVT